MPKKAIKLRGKPILQGDYEEVVYTKIIFNIDGNNDADPISFELFCNEY